MDITLITIAVLLPSPNCVTNTQLGEEFTQQSLEKNRVLINPYHVIYIGNVTTPFYSFSYIYLISIPIARC